MDTKPKTIAEYLQYLEANKGKFKQLQQLKEKLRRDSRSRVSDINRFELTPEEKLERESELASYVEYVQSLDISEAEAENMIKRFQFFAIIPSVRSPRCC